MDLITKLWPIVILLLSNHPAFAKGISDGLQLANLPAGSELEFNHDFTIKISNGKTQFEMFFMDGAVSKGSAYGGYIVQTTSPNPLGDAGDAFTMESAHLGFCRLLDEVSAYSVSPAGDDQSFTIKAGHLFTVRGMSPDPDGAVTICNQASCAKGQTPLLSCDRTDHQSVTVGDLRNITGAEIEITTPQN